MTALMINEKFIWLSLFHMALNQFGGDSIALGIVSLSPHLLGSQSPPVPLWPEETQR